MSKYALYLLTALFLIFTNKYLDCTEVENNAAIESFREYLRIDTSRDQNIHKVVEFWKKHAEKTGLIFAMYEPAGKPICVLTWRGLDPSLPSIMLNSHMDVVPVIEVNEEKGGFYGINSFIHTKEFKDLNVGFALDEGVASLGDDFLYATYVDRRPWVIKFTVKGNGGHSFEMPSDLAVKKLQRLLDIMLEYRKPLEIAVQSVQPKDLEAFTTMNINIVNGGLATNIIPETFTVVADLRLSPEEDASKIEALVNSWAEYAGSGTTVEYLRKYKVSLPTAVNESNPYWETLKGAVSEMGFHLLPIVSPATSDIVILRNIGIPAIGFTTKHLTRTRAHAANEYLNKDIFLKGIDIYVSIIRKLASTLAT